MAFAIRFNALGPGDRLEFAIDLYEAIALEVEKAEGSASEQGAVGRLAEPGAGVRRNPLFLSKGLEAVAVVAVDAVFSADPEKACAVLVNAVDNEVARPSEMPKVRKLYC